MSIIFRDKTSYKTGPELQNTLQELAKRLWGDSVYLKPVEGVPTSPGDPRLIKWVFRSITGDTLLFEVSLCPGLVEWEWPAVVTEKMMQLREALTLQKEEHR